MNNQQVNSNKFNKYICEYEYQGRKWDIDFYATSMEDAQNRLKSIAVGKIEGEIVFEIPVPLPDGIAAKVFKWIKQNKISFKKFDCVNL
jgi:hypothetical protein